MPNTSNPIRYNLATSEGGIGYIADLFTLHLKRHDFTDYIENKLAADFACVLARYISTCHDGARAGYAFDEDRELALCRLSWEKDRSIVFGDYWHGWKAALAERAAAIQDQPCVDVNARALERLLDVTANIHKDFAEYNAIRYEPLTETYISPSTGKQEENGVTVRVRLLNELGAALEALKGCEVSA